MPESHSIVLLAFTYAFYSLGMVFTVVAQFVRGDALYGFHPLSTRNLLLLVVWPLFWVLRVFCDPREKSKPGA